jgi:sec-independent protein translocase protein TatB
MFDISWTEFLLVGVVALIVIGPKELPGVLRTLGQWTRKVRSMAADFQNQFQEAMREAEMTDLKKQVDDLAHDFKSFDPLKGVRDDVEGVGKDIKSSLEQEHGAASSASDHAEPGAPVEIATVAALPEASPPPADEFPLPEAAAKLQDKDVVGTATGPVTPESADQAAQPNSTERTA